VAVAAVVLAALGVFGASAAPPPATDATAVSHWNLIAVNTLTGLPGPAGGAPPAAQIHVGMVQGAVYDAVNATEPKHHRPYLLKRRFSARASKEAAVATAAYGVLKSIVSTVPALTVEARAALLASLAAEVRRFARGDTRLAVQARGNRGGERGRGGHDRCEARRRAVWSVSVDAEPEPGALGSGGAERDDCARPNSVGGRRRAVPDAELALTP
jgi:hypothetical protein